MWLIMSKMVINSDSDPRHRRWFDCINFPFEYKYLIRGEMEILAREQDLVFQSPRPLHFCSEDGCGGNAYVLGIRADDEKYRNNFPLSIQFLATYEGGQGDIVFQSYFPVYDAGTEVEVTLTAIHQWENGIEATLEGTLLGGEREIAFYDTRYALCKEAYKIGETYLFKLAGFAHRIEVLKGTKVKLSPEATEMLCRASGKKLKYDADGNVVSMSVESKDMVAFAGRGGECPEDHEFQSSIRGFEQTSRRTDKHHVLKIACARGDDGTEVEIPLIVNPDLLGRTWPKVGQCVRGVLWMQGHCVV